MTASDETTVSQTEEAIGKAEALIETLQGEIEAMRGTPLPADDQLRIGRILATVEAWDEYFKGPETEAEHAILVCNLLDFHRVAADSVGAKSVDELARKITKYQRDTRLGAVPEQTWANVLQRWEKGKWLEPGSSGAPKKGETLWFHDVYCILVKAGLTRAASAKNMKDAVRRKLDRDAARKSAPETSGK